MTDPAAVAQSDLLLAFYGDDFTGSTDALEVMAFAGVEAVLFVAPPTPSQLARFRGARAIGIAGTARSRSPAWMDANLPAVFDWLFSLKAPVTQYKVCSTFDSSPEVGSIGRAIDLALPRSPSRWTPTVVAAPALHRYQAFGNLFAGASMGGRTRMERLDRHPTMARHPITPMDEADLRRHLARQTSRRIDLMDLVELAGPDPVATLQEKLAAGAEVVLFDAVDPDGLTRAGRTIWEARGDGLFSASSSGLDYALVGHLREIGLVGRPPLPPARPPAGQMLVVSGSCSPATARQIGHALAHGFAGAKLDVRRLREAASLEAAAEPLLEAGRKALKAGEDLAIYSAAGPDDPDILARDPALQERVGQLLGLVLQRLIEGSDIGRVLVAGGDTSGRVAAALDILALTALAPCAPGSPLCRVHSEDRRLDGLEIVFKGGQAGGEDFFSWVKAGAPRPA